MKGRVWMHVRELPGGRVIATPVPFLDLAADADTAEEAIADALERVNERVRSRISAQARAALTLESSARTETFELDVPDDDDEPDGASTPLRIGVVLVEVAASRGSQAYVTAPGVPHWATRRPDAAQALAAARSSLADELAGWSQVTLAALDDIGEVRIEEHFVELSRAVAGPSGKPVAPPPDLTGQGDDLTELAAAGKLGRLDHRDPLVERVLAILSGDSRSSVLLSGEPDVGKTALIHEIAFRLSAGEVPAVLRDRRMLRISANELIAGAQYTGMWQDRARSLIHAGRSGAIIVMDDPRGIVDAGRWSQSDNNLARILVPYVQRGELNLICEGSSEAIAAAREKEPGFVEAFQLVTVPESDADAVREILAAAQQRIETRHGVSFAADAVPAALELTRRFEPYRGLPGKAVRLLEETAQRAVTPGTGAGETHAAPAAPEALGRAAITHGFAARTGLPVALLSDEVAVKLGDVRKFFEERVLGQPEAVDELVDLIAVIKAALNDPDKPLSSLLFVGPTGVGKTELCKALAEYLFGSRDRVIRFDMGEFASGDAAARLVGSGWQNDGEGELTKRLREQPFCVLLLDEIEKAHPSVFDVLLSALGEARVTDAEGRTADLHNAIVIMTSNLGATRGGASGVGFGQPGAGEESARRRAHFVAEAEKFFRPEFFNRLDRLLVFEPLARETILRIARRELGRLLLREGITRRQLLIEIDPAVPDLIATAGFHPRYGARPLHREIERSVIRPLARAITELRPGAGDLIRLGPGEDGIAVSVDRVREAAPAAPRARPVRDEGGQSTLNRAVQDAEALLETVRLELVGPAFAAIDAELDGLLARINDPGFWDDPEAAQTVMARSYQLQRVLDRAHHITRRAEGLVELANQLRRRRDRGRLSDLRTGLAELDEQLLILRLEAAGGDEAATATISVSPVGGAGEWADRLVAMYAAWAQRGGREVTVDAEARRLVITAPGAQALLGGEVGLHVHEGAEQHRELARVSLLGTDGGDSDTETDGPGVAVRIYSAGKRTGVRDPRTRVKVGKLDAVLVEGRIDAFLLAAVALTAGTG